MEAEMNAEAVAADEKRAAAVARMAKARAAAKAKRETRAKDAAWDAARLGDGEKPHEPNYVPKLADSPAPKKEPEKTVKVIIEDSEEIAGTDNKRVFLGHNGRSVFVRTGVEVDLPEVFLNVMNDAKYSIPDKDPATMKLTGRMRDRMRFSFRRV